MNYRAWVWCTCLWILVCVSPARADAVDDLVNAALEKQGIPGLAVGVVRDGKLVKGQGYGLASVELGTPVRTDTLFQMASITKSFTACAVMVMVQDGALSLDDKLSKHVEGTPETWKDITIRHLLSHTSGLPGGDPLPGETPLSCQEIMKASIDMKMNSPTGEKYLYSNLGLALAGLIIEKKTGKRWDLFLQDRLLKPAGMTATRCCNTTDIIPHRAAGYHRNGKTLENAVVFRRESPSGGLLSSVEDMARWEAALLGDKILSKESKDLLWTPAVLKNGTKLHYGLGWMLGTYHGKKVIQHSGSRPGFITYFGRYPEDHLAVIVLTNLGEAKIVELAHAIVDVYSPAAK
jgi:D-alanyl-D-alanine carboxypeptidase